VNSSAKTTVDNGEASNLKDGRAVGIWLAVCCLLIFAMIVLGGVTRLTGSGLSMVDWQPISGVIPPISATQWEEEFAAYRESPEYLEINRGMNLSSFKTIFYFEYAHRMLGRLIGIAFLLPFAYFWFKRKIKNREVPRYVIMFVLGGLQGLLGWYMVQSGLVDIPHVSQYRLTAHLAAAFFIYGYILWMAFPLLFSRRSSLEVSSAGGKAMAMMIFIVITLLSGGFVAGLNAGHAFNTFPLMGGKIFPDGYFALNPWWKNLFDNIPSVQFNHRYLGILTYIIVCLFILTSWRDNVLKYYHWALSLLLFSVSIQGALGILTLILHVPVFIAAAHQAVGLIILTVTVYLVYLTRDSSRKKS
tara:strand:+ start:1526 stop:2602 length:1077 start_codon:yes stop_codon:yes gene_type:complete